MDISQELRDTENALRDFIASTLSNELGPDWVAQSGVTPERIVRWQERKDVEVKRQETGAVEERLLYYADFYDLGVILQKHWSYFAPALGEWKTMKVYLDMLEKLRDPDAHRRELLPHQKHLILGIGGEIRTRLVRYRSKQETAEDYFPRFESARDSLGSIWVPDPFHSLMKYVRTGQTLRPGDVVDFVGTASDPLGESLEYAVTVGHDREVAWQTSGTFRVRIEERHVARICTVKLRLRSGRAFRAFGDHDDTVEFVYTVLPVKT